MNNDKLFNLYINESTIHDLYIDDKQTKKEKNDLMSEIFNRMKQIGINNSYELLDIISTKNYSLLEDYVNNINNLILFTYNKLLNLYQIDLDNKVNYIIGKSISIGSYHQIIKIKNQYNKINYALRKQKDVSNTDLFDSFSDFFIHSILSLYQQIVYKQEIFIPNLYYIGINENMNKAIGVMTLYKGSLLDILSSKKINEVIKKKIIFNCLYQITLHLNKLQMTFKFTHNDLKVNNIFYESSKKLENLLDIDENIKINFYIGDFGFSRLKIYHPEKKKNIKIYGGALLSYSDNSRLHSFIPGKDLYFLCHNIYAYAPKNVKADIIDFFKLYNDFNLYLTINDNWFKIYDDFENHKYFEPNKFMKVFKKSNYYKYVFINT